MMKTECVVCNEKLPKTKGHYEIFGNYCTSCNAKLGPQADYLRQKRLETEANVAKRKALDDYYEAQYGKNEKEMVLFAKELEKELHG